MRKILGPVGLALVLSLAAWTPMDGTPAGTPDGTEVVWCVQPPVKTAGNDKRCTAKQIAQTLFLFSLKMPTRVATANDAWVVGTDYFICVDKVTGSATTLTLPASPNNGDTYMAGDCKGDAATNFITVNTTGGLQIDGINSNVLNTAWQTRAFTYVAGAGMWKSN